MAEQHEGLPVKGYKPQSEANVNAVNRNKVIEEQILRMLDTMKTNPEIDQRWLAIGRTSLEEAFMAINRAIFRPGRVMFTDRTKDGMPASNLDFDAD